MATTEQKADYVRAHQKHDGTHTCHWPGCNNRVPPAMWGCRKHWFKLPHHLRARIWATFRPGQEVTKTPSAEYIKAAREVREWVAQHYPSAPSA